MLTLSWVSDGQEEAGGRDRAADRIAGSVVSRARTGWRTTETESLL